ncbi:hypothetical protein GE115_06690 [Agromyces sp. CFH 90414]|uniref:Uncharacterized protein n=1 Tax=Agromyces agglutinans TaxID=2662258 RepID=A0A6I2FA15_9MICO|nr:hypothetical protein [Agromyces agglutinans]MRG59560.1 hypothetical protein [Agromyces agglutinans]
MPTTLGVKREPAPEGGGIDCDRATTARRVWLSILGFSIVVLGIGSVVTFGWMIDETRFDRPSPELDEFERHVEKLPGVRRVDTERWVEAPTFSNPTSWMTVAVDQAGLPGLLDAACSTDYPDAITWSIHVRTPAATEVTLRAAPTLRNAADRDARCPDFGFDAVRLVGELDRVVPGLAIQPAIWEEGRFALAALEEAPSAGYTHLLPLIEHADDLIAAAGIAENDAVEIDAMNLGLILEPGESAEYLAMLSRLAEDHAVSSYWADGGGTPIDGVEKVQIIAPDRQHRAIEDTVRSSRLHIAELPVRFLEQ